MTSAFGGQRSIQLSYGRIDICIAQGAVSGNILGDGMRKPIRQSLKV